MHDQDSDKEAENPSNQRAESAHRSGAASPMASDQQLDVLVAERVMGWRPLTDGSDGWASPDGRRKHWPGAPNFSTEMAAAMEVVEKMRNQGRAVAIMDSDDQWRVQFDLAERSSVSLPRAICEAALAATGGKE